LSVIIGQLIRLFAKSKDLSAVFCDFRVIQHFVDLFSHEQFIIESDAVKTLDAIMVGFTLGLDKREDKFVKWIENSNENIEFLNQMFLNMRQSEIYASKRLSMKLQYEIIRLGITKEIQLINKDYKNQTTLQPD
jgi:hypothetical protein